MSISVNIIVSDNNKPKDVVNYLHSLEGQPTKPKKIVILDGSDIPLWRDDKFLKNFNSKKFPETQLIYKNIKDKKKFYFRHFLI